ncbi:MAG TPA: vWA domain-containing protein [Anditalea sp.]|nr:vWA domain-containing protein [Anditalea sp.]
MTMHLPIKSFGKLPLLGLLILAASCQDITENADDLNLVETYEIQEVPDFIPPATVSLKNYLSKMSGSSFSNSSLEASSLTPSIDVTLLPEESHMEKLTGTISGAPSVADLMFIMDLTGSMGGELNNAKNNSINIMNSIRSIIPNTNFGLISHMDYLGYISGCGYGNTYGGVGDYPYRLDVNISSDINSVATGLNNLSLGWGSDGPESFSRAIWELSNDTNIKWRSGAKKISIFWLDDIPHDCNVFSLLGIAGSTGPDPGRDGIAGTADDIVFLDALNQMKENNISLITLYSNDVPRNLNLWKAASELTGGAAYQINSNGTIPGDLDLAEFITDLISENLNTINTLSVTSCDPDYSSWITGLSPASHTNITLDAPVSKEFDITITPPAGTAPGVYNFDLCLVGDGAEYAKTSVQVTVPDETFSDMVYFDIHPGSCPNPINPNRRGVIPTAILGTSSLDVSDIDVSTIRLIGVAPTAHAYEDVATPYISTGDPLNSRDCHTLRSDGFNDLTIKFDAQSVIRALGAVSRGEVLRLKITGNLKDGTAFEAEDVIIIA